jgi:hypothetical protein
MCVTSILRRIRKSLFLAVLGLGLARSAFANEPARPASAMQPPSGNQVLADRVADALRQNTVLHGFAVTLNCVDGVVDVSGNVADAGQRDLLLRQIQYVPGVARILDHLTVGASEIRQVQGSGSEGGTDRAPVLLQPPPDLRPQAPPIPEGAQGEPVPIFQAPPPSAMDMGMQRMPPYAWPTYAPYNNFSRVAYPLAYPYASWPFIGPFYPFPKVPPGWRCVRLEWEDGYWWFSKTACKHDWWHLRFW